MVKVRTLGNEIVMVWLEDSSVKLFIHDIEIITVKDGEVTSVTKNWDYFNSSKLYITQFAKELGMTEFSELTQTERRHHFIKKGLI